jgi:hypothetical protein
MASFYDKKTPEDMKQLIEKFLASYEDEFGTKLPLLVLKDEIQRLITEKQDAFIRDNFADHTPISLKNGIVAVDMLVNYINHEPAWANEEVQAFPSEEPVTVEEPKPKTKKTKAKK